MKQRMLRMDRLRHLRALQELRHEANFVRSQIRLRNVEREIQVETAAQASAKDDARQALVDANRTELIIAESLREVAEGTIGLLEPLRKNAAQAMQIAREHLADSRRETEQASVLVDGLRVELLREDDRRTQAESDDRYAARKSWMHRQTNLKMN